VHVCVCVRAKGRAWTSVVLRGVVGGVCGDVCGGGGAGDGVCRHLVGFRSKVK